MQVEDLYARVHAGHLRSAATPQRAGRGDERTVVRARGVRRRARLWPIRTWSTPELWGARSGAIMMKRKVLVLGAFVATAMAAASGCGGGDEKPAATEATAAAPATTVAATATAPATAATTTSTVATTTSSTRPTATVQQVASVLAREIPDWKSAVEGIGDCRLEILIGRCDVAQGISYMTATTIAGTIKTVLFAIDYPKAKSYIGDIPHELKALVTETMTKAEGGSACRGPSSTQRTAPRSCRAAQRPARSARGR